MPLTPTPSRAIRVTYPASRGQIALRTEADWDHTLLPVRSVLHWAKGGNTVVSPRARPPALAVRIYIPNDSRLTDS